MRSLLEPPKRKSFSPPHGSFFQEAYDSVSFAHADLAGRSAPRFMINSVYAVAQTALETLSVEEAAMFDRFGKARAFACRRIA